MSEFREIIDGVFADLQESGALRVWSVIITVFGDAVVPRGGVVGLVSLLPLLERIGIEQNAVRTAMSRLANDGWVVRERIGRQSFYSLAKDGQATFESAARRIYALQPSPWTGFFEIVLLRGQDHRNRPVTQRRMGEAGFGRIMPDVYLRPKVEFQPPVPVEDAAIVVETRTITPLTISDLVGQCWPVDDLATGYSRLVARFSSVLDALERTPEPVPMDALATRIVLAHEWRKVILKDVDLPISDKPHGQSELAARAIVGELYGKLLEPSEKCLEQFFAAPGRTLPAPRSEFGRRFKV